MKTDVLAPVEYAVAVDRYLAQAPLGPASRRVYRISLTSWAWPLVGKLPPAGTDRRRASPPVVPLALLDHDQAEGRLAAAVAYRIQHAQARTVNRELSALRSAIGWWQQLRWIDRDPTAALQHVAGQPAALRPLTSPQLAALFQLPTRLREQAFWHLLHDCGAPVDAVLALDVRAIDLIRRRAGPANAAGSGTIQWSARTSELLGWLIGGRPDGPAFLTDRRAPARTAAADICMLTGRGRMSYRRAAEIFTECTRPLDPAGRGWMLHQLRGPRSAERAAWPS